MKKFLITIAAAGLFASGANSADAALGVDFTSPTSTYMVSQPNTVAGWSFTANRDLYVRALGLYDHEPDLFHPETHSVGLWQADGTLLTSVTVSEPQYPHRQELVNGKYHMETTQNILLKAGQTYFVAATMTPDNTFAWFPTLAEAAAHNLAFDTNLTYGNAQLASSATLTMPTTEMSGIGFFGANIDVVPTPLPAAAWLLGSGLLGLAGMRRRQQP